MGGGRDGHRPLQAVEDGTADVAIAGISMTAERENRVDFTHPFFDAGLQIMTTTQSTPSIFQKIIHHFTPALMEILVIGSLFAIVMGHIIWLIERRINPEFPAATGSACSKASGGCLPLSPRENIRTRRREAWSGIS
jgi:hypothetical protein